MIDPVTLRGFRAYGEVWLDSASYLQTVMHFSLLRPFSPTLCVLLSQMIATWFQTISKVFSRQYAHEESTYPWL